MKAPSYERLLILMAVGESKSLSEAAAKLGISQPAVSVKLKQLESETPLPLFSTEGKRKVLTRYGRELCLIPKMIREEMQVRFNDLNRRFALAEHLTLKVGCRRELFEASAEKLKFPGRLEFVTLSSAAAVEALLDNRIDIAITHQVPDSAEVMAKKFLRSGSQIAFHRKFAKKRPLESLIRDRDFLLKTPCILYQTSGHLLADWLGHRDLRLDQARVAAVAEDWRTLQRLVDQGWGYAIVPDYIRSENPEILSIPIPHSVLREYVFYLLFHKHLKKVPAFQSLL